MPYSKKTLYDISQHQIGCNVNNKISILTFYASFNNCFVYLTTKELIKRKEYLDKLLAYKDKDIIKMVTSLRRSGKSTLLDMFNSHLLLNDVTSKQTQF